MSSLSVTVVQPHLHWEDKKVNPQMWGEKISSIKENKRTDYKKSRTTCFANKKPQDYLLQKAMRRIAREA